MKKEYFLTITILVICIVIALFSVLVDNSASEEEAAYEKAMENASDYMERGLYQLAAEEYEAAMDIKDSEEVRGLQFAAYEKAIQENDRLLADYIEAAVDAVNNYPTNVEFSLKLADLYNRNQSYKDAYDCLSDIIELGVENDTLIQKRKEIQYSFDIDWSNYVEIQPCCNGLYPVCEDTDWQYVSITGDTDSDKHYLYASRVDPEGIRFVFDGDQAYLVDSEGVKRGIFGIVPESASILSEGKIAIRADGSYGYYAQLGDYLFGKYLRAGVFQNGKAAVQTAETEWQLIDETGKPEATYEEIKLDLSDAYLVGDAYLAKKNGKFMIYHSDGQPVDGFACEDVDILTKDGLIAFCNDGKWGYVNTEGKVMISPTFEKARSFMNGLGAVCKDGKWGFLDLQGDIVIDYQFVDVDYFNEEGSCFVWIPKIQETESEENDEDNGTNDDIFQTETVSEGEETPSDKETRQSGWWQILTLHVK